MSTDQVSRADLQPHLGDRIRKALEVGDVTVQEMAGYLDVNRNTVSGWISLRHPPSRQSLRLIALRTGVPLIWLETGQAPADNPPGPGHQYAARDSNPEPSGYVLGLVRSAA